MENEIWFIDIQDINGAARTDAYEKIVDKFQSATTKPKWIMLDAWVSGDPLISKLCSADIPVKGMKFKKI